MDCVPRSLVYIIMLCVYLQFCDPGTAWRQRHKPLNPTLRVATQFNSEESARCMHTSCDMYSIFPDCIGNDLIHIIMMMSLSLSELSCGPGSGGREWWRRSSSHSPTPPPTTTSLCCTPPAPTSGQTTLQCVLQGP